MGRLSIHSEAHCDSFAGSQTDPWRLENYNTDFLAFNYHDFHDNYE